MRKIILNEEQFKRLIKLLKEQDESDYYKISPEEYIELITSASFNPKVFGIKKFGGKPLYVTGSLNLSGMKELSNLGNVAYINGSLNISNTNVNSIDNIEVKGNVNDYGSERERIRIRKEEMKKLAESDERREDGEWDLDNPNIDDEGLAANALFNSLVSDGDLAEMDEDIKTEIETKKQRLEELNTRYEDVDGVLEPEEVSPLHDEISELEDEIEEIQNKYADVYYIMPQRYRSYGTLYNFEVVGLRNREYIVGSYDDVYDAAVESQELLLDDVGLEGLPDWLINDNIDEDNVRDEMREFYEDDIRESPESYFDSDDFELTDEQEERKEQLENYISQLEEQQSNLEAEIEDPDEYSEKYDEIQERIDAAQEELDGIEPDTEPTDDMVEEKVNYSVRRQEPIEWLKEIGRDIRDFVDIKGVATNIVDSDGIGVLAGYDGQYDYKTVKTADGKSHEFVIMRTN